MAYSKLKQVNIKHWQELAPYQVGIIRGIRYAEIGTSGMEVTYAQDTPHLFKLLEFDRVQIVIDTRADGEEELDKREKLKQQVKVISSPLYSAALYHNLHKRHANLIPMLDRIVKEMKHSGELDRLLSQKPVKP